MTASQRDRGVARGARPAGRGRLASCCCAASPAAEGGTAVQVQLELSRRAGATAGAQDLRRDDDGSWTARVDGIPVRWIGAPDAAHRADGGLELELELGAGRHPRPGARPRRPAGELPGAHALWSATESAWRERRPRAARARARPRATAGWPCAVMRGLTTPGGGMVAAATTALPERADRGATGTTATCGCATSATRGRPRGKAGAWTLLDDAVRFVRRAAARARPGPRAGLHRRRRGGSRGPSNVGLPGYPGGTDQIGNQVRDQFQLDAFGEALLLFAEAARHDRLDADGARAAVTAARAVAERWNGPDAGVWEIDPTDGPTAG